MIGRTDLFAVSGKTCRAAAPFFSACGAVCKVGPLIALYKVRHKKGDMETAMLIYRKVMKIKGLGGFSASATCMAGMGEVCRSGEFCRVEGGKDDRT